MQRFFFDIYNDVQTDDDEGLELQDVATAMARAKTEAQNLAAVSIQERGHLILDHCIVVRDETGQTVGEVRFDEAVDIRASDGNSR